jgi:hypothetical protein
MDRSGVFYGIQPEWSVRLTLAVLGAAGYLGTILLSVRAMDRLIGGGGPERVRRAQRLSLISYLTGAVMYILVGFLNPHGLLIVLISSAASSLGGTSGLAWMMQLLDRKRELQEAPLALRRSWPWVIAGFFTTLLFAAFLGPTIRF